MITQPMFFSLPFWLTSSVVSWPVSRAQMRASTLEKFRKMVEGERIEEDRVSLQGWIRFRFGSGCILKYVVLGMTLNCIHIPHAGILAKLGSVGIRGKLLRSIEALYREPDACVRTGGRVTGKFSYDPRWRARRN